MFWHIGIYVTGTHQHGPAHTMSYRDNKFLTQSRATALKSLLQAINEQVGN